MYDEMKAFNEIALILPLIACFYDLGFRGIIKFLFA